RLFAWRVLRVRLTGGHGSARWFADGFVFWRVRHGCGCLRVPAGTAETLSGLTPGPREDVGLSACLARPVELAAGPDTFRLPVGKWIGRSSDVAFCRDPGERHLRRRVAELHFLPHDGTGAAGDDLRADSHRDSRPALRSRRARGDPDCRPWDRG